MAYDKKSFLAGIAVGRQMKGWSAAPVYLGGGDSVATILLNKEKEYQPSAVEKQMLVASLLNKSPCRILLELNQTSGLHVVVPASMSANTIIQGSGTYYFVGIVSAARADWFIVLYIDIDDVNDVDVEMFAFCTNNMGSTFSTTTAIKTRTFSMNLFGYANYVNHRWFYTSSLGSGTNRKFQMKTRYLNSDGSLDTTYEYRADTNNDLTVTFTRQ